MRPFLLKTFMLLAVTTSSLALADPPSRVGRIAVAEGQVAVYSGGNEADGSALLNWPVSSDSRIVTGRGALAEFRVGSAALRLAAGSELEVIELDDDNFRLRLNYGTLALRISNPEMLPGFELRTDLARVTLMQPGQLRVDARRDASVIGVLAGQAEVEGVGSPVTLTAGQRAEVRGDEMRLGALRRDAFDDWPERPEATAAPRYVSEDVTGYEELERYGSWQVDAEYGPVWQPRSVPAGWAPYRDGRWIWLAPWGWTWVDNAPWGYAPSHYGRWVLVGRRWCWAPGRGAARPAWAPALVGWVGGPQWQVTFAARDRQRTAPGVGWFPLSPRERYVPAYPVSREHQRRLDWSHERARNWRDARDPRRAERAGLTVVPDEQFRARATVPVTSAPQAVIAPGALSSIPPAPAPAPAAPPLRGESRRPDGRVGDGYWPRPQRSAEQRPAPAAAAGLAAPGQIMLAPAAPVQRSVAPAVGQTGTATSVTGGPASLADPRRGSHRTPVPVTEPAGALPQGAAPRDGPDQGYPRRSREPIATQQQQVPLQPARPQSVPLQPAQPQPAQLQPAQPRFAQPAQPQATQPPAAQSPLRTTQPIPMPIAKPAAPVAPASAPSRAAPPVQPPPAQSQPAQPRATQPQPAAVAAPLHTPNPEAQQRRAQGHEEAGREREARKAGQDKRE